MIPHPDFQNQLKSWLVNRDSGEINSWLLHLVYALYDRSDHSNQWAWGKLQEGLQASIDKSNNEGDTPEDPARP